MGRFDFHGGIPQQWQEVPAYLNAPVTAPGRLYLTQIKQSNFRRYALNMTNTNLPNIKVEIVSAPAINNMTVTPVGKNMFSLNLNMVLVFRFPAIGEGVEQNELLVSTALQSVRETQTGSSESMYADGAKPESNGEAAAFNDFVSAHGYPPPSREALSTWVQSQQGAST